MVILTADHGEALGESGLFYHGFMTPMTLRVPLLIRNPSSPSNHVIRPASLIDVAPTILSALGFSNSCFSGSPLSLSPDRVVLGESSMGVVFHENARLSDTAHIGEVGVTRLPWQLIYDYDLDTLTLLNLSNDPKGESNLAGPSLPEEGYLISLLSNFLSMHRSPAP